MTDWVVHGVDEETRQIAGLAAARAGKSVGAWIDEIILAKEGIDPARNDAPIEPAPVPPVTPIEPLQPVRQRARPAPPQPVESRSTGWVGPVVAMLLIVAVGAAWHWGLIPQSAKTQIAEITQPVSGWFTPETTKTETAGATGSAKTSTESGMPTPAHADIAPLTARAKSGDREAQVELGRRYAEGKSVEQDYAKARDWWEQAAQAGSGEAMIEIARLHEQGLGMPKNQEVAADWYRRAVTAGSARAKTKLSNEQEPAASPAQAAAATPPSDGSDSQQAPLDKSEISELQTLLGRLDLDPGPATGEMNEETVKALRLYQQFAGLPEDGKPTRALLIDLRQVVNAMSTNPPAN